MQLPVKVHYATLAMLALAAKYSSKDPVSARAIAQEHGIPSQFLTQILQQLRSSNLVTSTRGANGGFLLENSPESISLADIFDSICPTSGSSATEEESSVYASAVHAVWEELRQQERKTLKSVNLNELLERAGSNTDMFYI